MLLREGQYKRAKLYGHLLRIPAPSTVVYGECVPPGKSLLDSLCHLSVQSRQHRLLVLSSVFLYQRSYSSQSVTAEKRRSRIRYRVTMVQFLRCQCRSNDSLILAWRSFVGDLRSSSQLDLLKSAYAYRRQFDVREKKEKTNARIYSAY